MLLCNACGIWVLRTKGAAQRPRELWDSAQQAYKQPAAQGNKPAQATRQAAAPEWNNPGPVQLLYVAQPAAAAVGKQLPAPAAAAPKAAVAPGAACPSAGPVPAQYPGSATASRQVRNAVGEALLAGRSCGGLAIGLSGSHLQPR